MKKTSHSFIYFFLSLFLVFSGCKESKPRLKIAASSIPHAEILEFIKPKLLEKNIDLDIIVIDDYQTPNRALSDKEVDANYFQHYPFLQQQTQDFNYSLESLVGVHLEPMGIYSRTLTSLDQIKPDSTVAIPSDPSNHARALELLAQANLIKIKDRGNKTTLLDVTENPLRLQFTDMEALAIAHALDDVDLAVLNTNYALLAGLSPKTDALAIENGQSRFVNLVVVRQGDTDRADLQELKKALTTEEVRQFINEHYKGAISPAF